MVFHRGCNHPIHRVPIGYVRNPAGIVCYTVMTHDVTTPLTIADESLDRRILIVQGLKVMLDSDLAQLYGVETRVLNQAVRRNPERFPPDFIVRVTPGEITKMTSQDVTSSLQHGGRRKSAFGFTEHGVAMLSSVLQSHRAIQVNIAIMRAFARLRDMVTLHAEVRRRLNEMEAKYDGMEHRYDGQFDRVFDVLREIIQATNPTFGRPSTTTSPG